MDELGRATVREDPATSSNMLRRGTSDETELAAQIKSIARWGFLAVAAAAMSAAAAFGGVSLTPTSYGAQTEVAFFARDRPELPEQYLSTQIFLVGSRAILGPVSATLRIPVRDLEKNLSVHFPGGGAVMRLQYAAREGSVALQVLEAILSRYAGVLEQMEPRQRTGHAVLVPPYVLEEPVRPRPFRAAAIGAAAGLVAVFIAFLALWARRTNGGNS